MEVKTCSHCATQMLGFQKQWNPETGQYRLVISEEGQAWTPCGPLFDTSEAADTYREQEVRLRRYH